MADENTTKRADFPTLPGLDKEIRPRIDGGVPWCDTDGCPSFDGKRCRTLGFTPGSICEPTVVEMSRALVEAQGIVAGVAIDVARKRASKRQAIATVDQTPTPKPIAGFGSDVDDALDTSAQPAQVAVDREDRRTVIQLADQKITIRELVDGDVLIQNSHAAPIALPRAQALELEQWFVDRRANSRRVGDIVHVGGLPLVSVDALLNELAGMKFPDAGAAYEYVKGWVQRG